MEEQEGEENELVRESEKPETRQRSREKRVRKARKHVEEQEGEEKGLKKESEKPENKLRSRRERRRSW